jgi:uncharacterized membrane protein YdjX (TVP38/TMEM64 family)
LKLQGAAISTGEFKEKKGLTGADIAKFAGLVAIIVAIVVLTIVFWPRVADYASEKGVEGIIADVRASGPLGVLILFGLQVAQVVFAVIPGEATQIAAGMLYGPLFGPLVVLAGALFSTVMIYYLVHFLGYPFVNKALPKNAMEKFHFIGETQARKLDVIVFLLFLTPGLPKDVFTYILPLTRIKPSRFFLLTTVGRAPGVFVSAYLGETALSGDWVLIAVVVLVVLAVLGAFVLFRKRVMKLLHRISGAGEGAEPQQAGAGAEGDKGRPQEGDTEKREDDEH